MMQERVAFESKAGNLYRNAAECAAEDLSALSKPAGTNGEHIGRDQAMALVKNRREVIQILKSVDCGIDEALGQ